MILRKKMLYTIIVVALFFIVIDMGKTYYKCSPNKVIYRFIPRTFVEEQENPVPIDHVFKAMFEQPSPWVHSFDIHRSKRDINDDFIGVNGGSSNNVDITVYFTSIGNSGEYIDMNFSGMYDDNQGATHTITGSLHVIRDF